MPKRGGASLERLDDPSDEEFTRAGLDPNKGGNGLLLFYHATVILCLGLNVPASGYVYFVILEMSIGAEHVSIHLRNMSFFLHASNLCLVENSHKGSACALKAALRRESYVKKLPKSCLLRNQRELQGCCSCW